MTCQEVAKCFETAEITARKWAAANGVNFTGEGVRKTYQWTEDDCKRFSERREPGWEKGRPRKTILSDFHVLCIKDGEYYDLMLVVNSVFGSKEPRKYRLVVCPAGGMQYNAEIQPKPGTWPDIQDLAVENGFEVIDLKDLI